MKKKVFGRKLSRERDTRRALYKSLTRALILHGKIETTKAKAKSIVPYVENLVRLAKSGTTSNKRRVYGITGNDRKIAELVGSFAPKFKRVSGLTRLVNLPRRSGDGAEMVRLEWSEQVSPSEQSKSKKEKNEKGQGKSVNKSRESSPKKTASKK